MVKGITPFALQVLLENDWPGNVRELENVIERAVVLAEKKRIEVSALPVEIRKETHGDNPKEMHKGYSIKKMSRIMEEQLIRKALDKTQGNRTHAARLLEISHPALLSKMKAYDIDL